MPKPRLSGFGDSRIGKSRETNGDRTRDSRNHNPVLYQLSYGLRKAGTIPLARFPVNRGTVEPQVSDLAAALIASRLC